MCSALGSCLLEVFTGRRPTDPMFVGTMSLRQWVLEALPGRLADVVDDRQLRGEIVIQGDLESNKTASLESEMALLSLLELGLACCSELPAQRTEMNDVVTKLKSIRKDYST